MRKLAIAVALASTALASPAVARDGSGYVGIDGGVMILEDFDLDYAENFDGTDDDFFLEDGIVIDSKLGYDVGLVAGYDLGMFRAEAEVAYKRASFGDAIINEQLSGFQAGENNFDIDGKATALSLMANLMLDFGGNEVGEVGGFIGGGFGFTSVKLSAETGDLDPSADDVLILGGDDRDSAMAWQVIAGLRYAISPNLDLGLKYRFFNTGKLQFEDDDVTYLEGRWRSHSLLASLVFNFAPPPPAPERG